MMTKWREVTSAECQEDFDDLLDVCVEIAAERISENWGLDPVAVVNRISLGLKIFPLEGEAGTSSTVTVHDRLVGQLRAASEDLRSYAIVFDATAEGASDTHLEVLLEHREYAMQICVPYVISDVRAFDLGPMKAAVGQRLLWG
ncbi:hypothetical protein [Rhodococcoides yunnanense]|uniref:Uncharacterized protein n=1 Tax=Rhodococcoides yunnanense TaxID=278209 RepID=A0ABU4B741_9NOCA|nr:hypothetical protein [Rhodococcus yunnanensis]MDV6260005.1 hypothetical protein [Rhodococcus yunnanensis]